jgi:hypothetical protein
VYVDLIGATPNEVLFAVVLTALVLLGTKLGAVGEALARVMTRRR